jgi:hypothetical protein
MIDCLPYCVLHIQIDSYYSDDDDAFALDDNPLRPWNNIVDQISLPLTRYVSHP